jgi:hypothetical protein
MKGNIRVLEWMREVVLHLRTVRICVLLHPTYDMPGTLRKNVILL